MGDETNINFWLDSWCNNCFLADLMKVHDISSIDNSLRVSEFILPYKVWDIAKLKGLVNHSHLQMILATPLFLIPFVGTCLEVESSLPNRQHGLPMDWICINSSPGSSTGSGS